MMDYKNMMPAKMPFGKGAGMTPTTYANTGVPNTGNIGAPAIITGKGSDNMAKPTMYGKELGMAKKAAGMANKPAGVGKGKPASAGVGKGIGVKGKAMAPGQMKKAAGVKGSAKQFAPGQMKKAGVGVATSSGSRTASKPVAPTSGTDWAAMKTKKY